MNKKITPSIETQQTASKLAKANQKSTLTKEQKKLIEQGIQKGIEQYKKAQKAKAREADKFKKKQLKAKLSHQAAPDNPENDAPSSKALYLPWSLLVISWLAFIVYLIQ